MSNHGMAILFAGELLFVIVFARYLNKKRGFEFPKNLTLAFWPTILLNLGITVGNLIKLIAIERYYHVGGN